MEAVEEVAGGSNRDDLSLVVKGKRTKRSRPQSPIPFTIPTTHSSNGGRGGEREVTTDGTTTSSPPASTDAAFPSTSTEEDKDIARCLILLSKSGNRRRARTESPPNYYEILDATNNNDRFSSKKYIETTTSTGNKVGRYVFECKTCSRTFPSFQALGGHRASHKKAKLPLTIEARKPFSLYDNDVDDPSLYYRTNNNYDITKVSPLASLQFCVGKSSPKIHECSYCGAEFTSGQALGGHMRRHRGGTTNTATASFLSPSLLLSPALPLDLNLPAAPEADHHRRHSRNLNDYQLSLTASKPQYNHQEHSEKKEQEVALVLSTTPSLVDCKR